MTKIYLRGNFFPEVVKFYEKHFAIVDEKEADILVINDFNPIEAPDKIVACNSTGLDHIKAKKIISLRGEDLSSLTAVAELTLAMGIYCMRIFRKEEIKGKILGIIGYGRIGQRFDEYASYIGVNTCFYDKENRQDLWTRKLWARKLSLKQLLKKSDIISLHITADESNRNFIDREKFEMMKDGTIFLNSARPWLVEEKGLKWALNNKLAGCWTDFDLPFTHPKLLTTPHIAGGTLESRRKTELIIAHKLKKLYC